MKSKVYGIRISSVLVAVAIVMIVVAVLIKDCAAVSSLLNNLGMGVFGSSIVVLLVSIGEYQVEKKRTLLDYYHLASDISIQFYGIKYFHFTEETDLLIAYQKESKDNELWRKLGRPDKTEAKDKLIEHYITEGLITEELTQVQKDYIPEVRLEITTDKLLKAFESYVHLFEVSTKDLTESFSNIYFFSKQETKNVLFDLILRKIQNPIAEKMNFVGEKSYHFKVFLNGETKNLAAVYNILKDAQKPFFDVDIKTNENRDYITIWNTFADELSENIESLRNKVTGENNKTHKIPITGTINHLGGNENA